MFQRLGVHRLKLHQGKCKFPSGLFGPHDLLRRFGSPKGQGWCDCQGSQTTNLNQLKAFLGWLQIVNNNLSKGLIKLPNLWINWPKLMWSSFGVMHKDNFFENWKLDLIWHLFWGDISKAILSNYIWIRVFWDLNQSLHKVLKIRSLWWFMQVSLITKQNQI